MTANRNKLWGTAAHAGGIPGWSYNLFTLPWDLSEPGALLMPGLAVSGDLNFKLLGQTTRVDRVITNFRSLMSTQTNDGSPTPPRGRGRGRGRGFRGRARGGVGGHGRGTQARSGDGHQASHQRGQPRSKLTHCSLHPRAFEASLVLTICVSFISPNRKILLFILTMVQLIIAHPRGTTQG